MTNETPRHDDNCPKGPHVHGPHGIIVELASLEVVPGDGGGGGNGMGMAGEVSVPRPRLQAFEHLALIAVALLDGRAEYQRTTTEYLDMAEASLSGDWPRNMAALDRLFQYLAAKNGPPENPASAIAGTMTLVAEMVEIMRELRGFLAEEAAEEKEEVSS